MALINNVEKTATITLKLNEYKLLKNVLIAYKINVEATGETLNSNELKLINKLIK